MGTGGSTSRTESLSRAFTSAYASTFFNCQSNTDASNVVRVSGACSCTDVGIYNGRSCDEYVAQAAAANREKCIIFAALVKAGRATTDQLLCACNGSGCVLGLDQSSTFTDMVACDSTRDIRQTTAADFEDNIRASLTRENHDVGQLMQNGQDNLFINAVKDFHGSVTDTTNTTILRTIQAGNTAEVGCGAVVANLTQRSQFNAILSAIQDNKVAQDALAKMRTTAEAQIAVTNKGLYGDFWALFSNPLFMIAIIIVCCIVAYVLYQKLVGGGGGGGGQPNIIYVQPQQAPNNPRNS